MERMWRKVGGFTGRTSKSSTTIQSDTASAAGFGDDQIQVVAVSGSGAVGGVPSTSSAVTGRRLASSGEQLPAGMVGNSSGGGMSSSFSQHVLQQSTASSERRRRRRRKSRQRTSNRDKLFGGFRNESSSNQISDNANDVCTSVEYGAGNNAAAALPHNRQDSKRSERNVANRTSRDPSLRQRAVAKLRMFNFHLNWDLHMTQCKPCVPRSGNILTRRLCRNRRGEDNELYRSNSFKFERFERKEVNENGETLHRKISVCDDYSLPIDFVKKRPSSFDPCLAETLPDNWAVIAPSPLSEHVSFLDPPVPAFKHPPITLIQHQQYPQHHLQQQQQQQQQHLQQQQQQLQQQLYAQHQCQTKPPQTHLIQPQQPQYTNVKLIEGYSDPKDSRTQTRTNRRSRRDTTTLRNNYNSDSSAPKSSADDDENKLLDNQLGGPRKIPELNSPDSISEDLVHPLQPYKSPKRLTGIPEVHKRNPSPYYYSDLLKSKEKEESKEEKSKCRQSTASEPPAQTAQPENQTPYRKSTSLDVPETNDGKNLNDCPNPVESNKKEADQQQQHQQQKSQTQKTPTTNKQKRLHKTLPTPDVHSRRYSVTEDGVRIIRCASPSTTTSDDSDCSECQQRREWHAKALALVRKTCNVQTNQPLQVGGFIAQSGNGAELQSVNILGNCGGTGSGDQCDQSMPPHRLLGPTVCACAAPATLNDEMEEYFRPRSVFYVHPQGVHECADCIPGPGSASTAGSGKSNIINANNTTNITPIATLSSDKSNKSNRSNRSRSSGGRVHTHEEDNMSSGGTGTGGSGRQPRKIYETAFDCKVPKSDDDLDEVVERFTSSHNALLEIENGNNLKTKPPLELKSKSLKYSKSNKLRYEGKRQKNTKNQQIQQDNGGNKNTIGSIQTLSNELEKIHIDNSSVDQLNNTTDVAATTETTISTSQLPTRGYTPSPPSTAPLPVKFPAKHDRFYMNSIKSAPSLPSSNPAHPRLRDLRLPIKSLRHQQLGSCVSVEGTAATAQSDSTNNLLTGSNASSLLDSGTGQMIVTESSRTRDRPRSIVVLESGRVLELRTGSAHKTMNSNGGHHHHHNHHHGVAMHHTTTANTNTDKNNQNNNQHIHQQHNKTTTTINYSSTESMATSSSGGSMESLRSSTSEGNRSTTSSESRHSTSLSSHSSESGPSVAFPLRAPLLLHSKLHILSPISDKSSLEPASDASELNKKQTPPGGGNGADDAHNAPKINQLSNIQEQEQQTGDNTNRNEKMGGGGNATTGNVGGSSITNTQKQLKKRIPQNKALLMLTDEILGSDSGISLHSREDNKIQSAFHRFGLPKLNFSNSDKLQDSGVNSVSIGLPQDLRDLPFDMPKLRRRKIILQQDVCTSGSATSVDLGDLPFDMPKLRRRLRMNSQQQQQINNLIVQSTESSGISQASSSHSVDQKPGLDGSLFRQNLTLNFNEIKSINNHKFGSLDLRGATAQSKGLNLNLSSAGIGFQSAVDLIDVSIPLERQGWYHGAITRIEAESTLRPLSEGSFLVRNCESTKQDYSLSLKGAKGFMHMRIQRNESNQYILGQFSRPFDSVPEMIRHFCINRLPVRGAEHMCLLDPVIVQLL